MCKSNLYFPYLTLKTILALNGINFVLFFAKS